MLTAVHVHHVECQGEHAGLGQWHGQVHERVKLGTVGSAAGAVQCALVQTLEMVHNEGVVALAVVVPCLCSKLLIRSVVAVLLLNIGLVLNAVQVLMQAIQQERKELLAVMLRIATELRSKAANAVFEVPRCHMGNSTLPEQLHELPKALRQLPMHAQRVGAVQVVRVPAREEATHEGHRVRKALQAAIHEASVAKVGQARQPSLFVGGWKGHILGSNYASEGAPIC
mmetsp:Transcript_10307/g.28128  ORF Transcript_10307/g.28128 Transcript_10307/m.28128 type:complete len:227 (-) Transcript_10307:603-1283(-)